MNSKTSLLGIALLLILIDVAGQPLKDVRVTAFENMSSSKSDKRLFRRDYLRLTPALREISEGATTVSNKMHHRRYFFVGGDIPLLNFYTKPKNK